MTRRVAVVFSKEVLDNFRDRRTLLSALVFGPLFGPLLIALMIAMLLSRAISEADEPLDVPVIGADHAPNLMRFFEQNNARIDRIDDTLEAADDPLPQIEALVSDGDYNLILIVSPDYAEDFRSGRPAGVRFVSDQSNSSAAKDIRRARGVLANYNSRLRSLRLLARGMDPAIMTPVAVDDVDVSTPAGRSLLILGMMTYVILLSMLMGGLYLAIDTTAGERERGSLEPLLTLPVTRDQLIAGKILATCFFMTLSLGITVAAFVIGLRFVPLEEIGMSANFGIVVGLKVVAAMLPFIPFGAAMMTVVASFTKSYKEAQSYLTILLVIPTLPILLAAVFTLKPNIWLMTIPSLSQHLLVTGIMRDDPVDLLDAAVSVSSTLFLGAIFVWLAARLYRREGILG